MADEVSPRYTRQVQVLWRVAPDRVLVRRPWPKEGQDEAADLLGMAALVWIALDEPGSVAEILERLDEARDDSDPGHDPNVVRDTVDQLLATAWIEPAPSLARSALSRARGGDRRLERDTSRPAT